MIITSKLFLLPAFCAFIYPVREKSPTSLPVRFGIIVAKERIQGNGIIFSLIVAELFGEKVPEMLPFLHRTSLKKYTGI